MEKIEKKKEKLTFSKIEILFMLVLMALLMTAGITVFTITTNNRKEQNLKEEAVRLSSLAVNTYTYLQHKDDTEHIVVGSDGTTKGMCITAKALDDDTEFDGYFVVEETMAKKKVISVWLTDNRLVIDGFTSDKVKDLKSGAGLTKYNNNKFTERVMSSFTGANKDNGGLESTPNRYEVECINVKID